MEWWLQQNTGIIQITISMMPVFHWNNENKKIFESSNLLRPYVLCTCFKGQMNSALIWNWNTYACGNIHKKKEKRWRTLLLWNDKLNLQSRCTQKILHPTKVKAGFLRRTNRNYYSKIFFMIIFKFHLGKRGLWISQKLNVKVNPMFFLLRISWHVVNFLFMHEILKYSYTCLFRKFSIHFLCLFQIKYLKLESELWKMCTWLRYTWNFSFWVCLFWCEFVGRSLFKSWIVFWKIIQIYFDIHISP